MPGDTGSDLLALAYALGYVKAVGGPTTYNRELFEAARTGIGRLVTTQNKDGGWNWIGITKHGDSGSSARVTSRNFWALTEARKQGVYVDDGVLAKATAYLKNRFAKTDQKDDETKGDYPSRLINRRRRRFCLRESALPPPESANIPRACVYGVDFCEFRPDGNCRGGT